MKNYFFKALVSFGILNLMHVKALMAATLTVTNIADSGAGSLRDAMENAANQDQIVFDQLLSGTISLASSLPIINASLTITGNNNVTIDGQSLYQIFFANQGTVSISQLTLSNGNSTGGNGGTSYSGNGGGALGAGGALFVNSQANVTLANVLLSGNIAQGGNGGSSNSLYFDTGAGGGGGGGYNGGIGGNGGFNLVDGSGGGGGGGFAGFGGLGFTGGGGGGGFTGFINSLTIVGDGAAAGLNGGNGGEGFGGTDTGGLGGTGGSTPTNGGDGDTLAGGGGGGGGGANTLSATGGNGGASGPIGGGGGGGGGSQGGVGGNAGDFGGGGGGGGSIGSGLLANGGQGQFAGGGGGGGGVSLATSTAGAGGAGGFGAGGGGGGKNADGGLGGFGGGQGGGNDGGGGGGAGFGGAIFVRSGGTLVLTNIQVLNNAAQNGSGGVQSSNSGQDGIADGDDLYVMSNTTTNITTPQGAKMSISGPGQVLKLGSAQLTHQASSPTTMATLAAMRHAIEQGNIGDVDTTSSPNPTVQEGIYFIKQVIVNQVHVKQNGHFRGEGITYQVHNHGVVRSSARVGQNTTSALIVSDSYTQHPKGTLTVDIYPNGDSNQLFVHGQSTLNGTLRIHLNPGSYQKGKRYTVLNSPTGITGKFNSLVITGHQHMNAKVIYHSQSVQIELSNSVMVL